MKPQGDLPLVDAPCYEASGKIPKHVVVSLHLTYKPISSMLVAEKSNVLSAIGNPEGFIYFQCCKTSDIVFLLTRKTLKYAGAYFKCLLTEGP